MKLFGCLIVLLLTCIVLPAQQAKAPVNKYAAIDLNMQNMPAAEATNAEGIAKYINEHFTKEEDKARAAFIWVASNIAYDIDNIYAINLYEKKEDRIAKAFISRKGICIDYAHIFNDICKLCGLRSYVVSGYNWPTGMDGYLAHAWCIVYLDNHWFVFDPTWGAGYIKDKKYVTKIDNYYFKAEPYKIIHSHMPFDPLWQCLNYPVTSAEFYDNKVVINTSKPYFSYKDSINAWEHLPLVEQDEAAARRIEQNGVKNSMTFDRLHHLKSAIMYNSEVAASHKKYIEDSTAVSLYNLASETFADGTHDYNRFVMYKNHQFMPPKEDDEIWAMITGPDAKLVKARLLLESIQTADISRKKSIDKLYASIKENQELVDTQKEFVQQYLSKSKLGRKFMFTNIGAK